MKTIKKVRFSLKHSKEDLLVENEERLSSDDDIADADFETIDLTFSSDVNDNHLSNENNNELKGVEKKKKKFRKRVGYIYVFLTFHTFTQKHCKTKL